jgi:hypothetical protein
MNEFRPNTGMFDEVSGGRADEIIEEDKSQAMF